MRMFAGFLATALLAAIVCAGCSEDATTSPGTGLEVANDPDNFQYQVTGVSGYSQQIDYTWQNTGTTATVNQSTTVTGGTMTLKLLDDAGTEVYSRSLAENGTFTSAAGEPGSWTIRIVYSGASGTVNFRVQKTT